MQANVDIAIVGAGPFGLSIAAHLRGSGKSLRIFGTPMQIW
ncbi:NAD(P)-binding protein, partial [Burkholderia sp. SIMBA_052]